VSAVPISGPWLVILAAYGLLSIVTFAVYGADKRAAVRGAWRTPEATLHTLALLGGWPGALVAQRVFRHKSRKRSFLAVFWVTVAVNSAALAVVLNLLGQR